MSKRRIRGEKSGLLLAALALAGGSVQCGREASSTLGASGGGGVAGSTAQPVAMGGDGDRGNPGDLTEVAGADGTSLGVGGEGGAAVKVPPLVQAKNYELNGMMPELTAAIATKPGKLKYTKIVIQSEFLAESCSIADYNNDGIPDVSSGRIWYEGTTDDTTTFKTAHPFRDGHGPLPRDGAGPELNTGVSDDWADYPLDVNHDGNMDIINVAQPDVPEANDPTAPSAGTPNKIGTVQPHGTAFWFENPGPAAQAGDPNWSPHLINSDVRLQQHGLVDINGDGFPELLGACRGCVPMETKGFYQADSASPNLPWTFHSVTIHYTFPYGDLGQLNGIGAGDVNGDGRPDLLERGGVWLQEPNEAWNKTVCTGSNAPSGCGWIAAQTPLLPTSIDDGLPDELDARGPAQVFAADMDGDGLTDLVAADYVYGNGLSWYRQTEGMNFVKYKFMGGTSANDISEWGVGFSSPVAVQVVDMDGDGAPDVVTGKMRFAQPLNCNLPDPNGTPYVYVFKNVRGKVDPNSGAPITLQPVRVDPSGTPDLSLNGTPDGGMGVGRQIAVGQLNGDGIPDFCVASKVGLAVFLGQ